ncbi:hypothetical protein AB1Y20_003463 [Prymnesium parvum]|uniref:3-deoxy-7-phosphoheptulonate synthase n=1 Tax=Prymnesium parvum TaxID=97485 RepID=A0AB34JE75_PRYPA
MGGLAEPEPEDDALCPEDLDDLRIRDIRPLMPSACLIEEIAAPDVYGMITAARSQLSRAVRGADDRLIVVAGPPSTHDPAATLEYARRLKPLALQYKDELLLVVRVFLDRPDGGAGSWSGAMYDPDLDGSYAINKGFRQARQLLLDISKLGLPAGCIYLDTISPQFIADLVSWSAISERTAESKLHRELASGLSTPVGFQAAHANFNIAAEAVRASAAPHTFLSVSKQGVAGIVQTTGNRDCHTVVPASTEAEEQAACETLAALGLPARLMIDCGAGKAQVDPDVQAKAAAEVASRIASGSTHACGVLLASFLEGGRQSLAEGTAALTEGQSVTAACIDWPTTAAILQSLAAAVRQRRANPQPPAAARAESRGPTNTGLFAELGSTPATDNLRITAIRPLLPPACLLEELPAPQHTKQLVLQTRCAISAVLQGSSDRLLVLAGPHTAHDAKAAMEFAARLAAAARKHAAELLVVMALTFERPSSDAALGWKGMIHDPDLDGSYAINKGFRLARGLLLDINGLGLPTGSIFSDTITPQFIADLNSLAMVGSQAIGSRAHRELASGLSTPVGFQAAAGSSYLAVDAVRASAAPHAFLSVSKQGVAGIVETTGNRDCHAVLPATGEAEEQAVCETLQKLELPPRVVIDCGSAKGRADPEAQAQSAAEVAGRIAKGSTHVCGVMLDSFLLSGSQELKKGITPAFGMSVTTPCLDWGTTASLLDKLAAAVRDRREAAAPNKKPRTA